MPELNQVFEGINSQYYTEFGKSITRYFQSINKLQEDLLKTWLNFFVGNNAFIKELAEEISINVELPDMLTEYATLKNNQNRYNIMGIDILQQTLKIYNNSIKTGSEINTIFILLPIMHTKAQTDLVTNQNYKASEENVGKS